MEKKEINQNLRSILKLILEGIGPDELIDGAKYTFQDNLKFSETYFAAPYLLKKNIFDKISSYKGKVNNETSYQIMNRVAKGIYEKIKSRAETIDNTLDKYVIDADFDWACSVFESILKDSSGKYKVALITNLIDLIEVDHLAIGNISLYKIDANYLSDWPENIMSAPALSALGFGVKSPVVTKADFIKKNEGFVALETIVEGIHFEDEPSSVYAAAINNFKQLFAFLYMCRYFLENIKEPHVIKITTTNRLSLSGYVNGDIQNYYIKKAPTIDSPRPVKKFGENSVLSNHFFTIDKEVVDLLNSKCFLQKYNDLILNRKGEIGEKILRSLDWFLKSVLEKDSIDVAISLFISLESLLSLGSDPLTSHTDDMAENIAIMLSANADKRYERKNEFKKKIYPLRNKIMHHGTKCSSDEDMESVALLETYVVWSIRGILSRLDKIFNYGHNAKAMREYFEREKLK